MRTDRQVYKILAACPQWFFDLTQIESPGSCVWKSIALKEVSVTADGVIEPLEAEKPWFVVEFQAQFDETVYIRLVLEMALLQKQRPDRQIEGAIIFLDPSMDPKTQPWQRVIRTFSLVEQIAELELQRPDHPLLAVFAPLTVSSDAQLESTAAVRYNWIVDSQLDELTKKVLTDVFVSWLEQRFRDKGKQEIEAMLIGALPDLTETQSGKDLIQIGIQKGKAEGKAESLLLILRCRFGDIPQAIFDTLSQIQSDQRLNDLTQQAVQINALDELEL